MFAEKRVQKRLKVDKDVTHTEITNMLHAICDIHGTSDLVFVFGYVGESKYDESTAANKFAPVIASMPDTISAMLQVAPTTKLPKKTAGDWIDRV